MAGKFRKAIRIGGKKIERVFYSRAKANEWYAQMHSHKVFSEANLNHIVDENIRLVDFFNNTWLPMRMANYPQSTWKSDEQRFRTYVEPMIGGSVISKVTTVQVRSLLVRITAELKLSSETRNRVRSLISAIYNEAINREFPLAFSNPTFGIRFTGQRTGKKQPSFLKSGNECLKFLEAARSLSQFHLTYASLILMSGVRKQEMIALRWGSISFDDGFIRVSEKFIQAGGVIVPGTKRGSNVVRDIPIPAALVEVLVKWRDQSEFQADDDFVFSDNDGAHIQARKFSDIHYQVCEASGLKVTIHGLRHTFGREFAEKSKNMRALQDILGHSSYVTTQKYSELGKDRLMPFSETVSFSIENKGTRKSD